MRLDLKQTRPHSPEPSDDELALLQRSQTGDTAAFQELLRPHLGSLLALGRRLTGDHQWGEDLTQETLVRALRGIGQFRGEASFRTWLFRIQVRLASEPARWRRRDRATPLAHIEVPDHLGAAPDEPAVMRELHDRIEEAMERLPARQRTALHLRAFEGLDYEAIASALQCSTGAARMLVLEARRRIMTRMGRHLAP